MHDKKFSFGNFAPQTFATLGVGAFFLAIQVPVPQITVHAKPRFWVAPVPRGADRFGKKPARRPGARAGDHGGEDQLSEDHETRGGDPIVTAGEGLLEQDGAYALKKYRIRRNRKHDA